MKPRKRDIFFLLFYITVLVISIIAIRPPISLYASESAAGPGTNPYNYPNPRVDTRPSPPSGMLASKDGEPDTSGYPPGMRPPESGGEVNDETYNPFDMGKDKKEVDENSEDDGSWWNPFSWPKKVSNRVSQWAWQAVNNIMLKAARQAFLSVMSFVADNVFQDIDLKKESRVTNIVSQASSSAGALFTLLIVILGLKVMMGDSVGSSYRIKSVLPRLFVAAVCAIFALPICQLFINMAHSASLTIMTWFNPKTLAAYNPMDYLWKSLTGEAQLVGFLSSILMLFVLIGFGCLGVFYLIRKAALIVLCIMAPFAFVMWADESTSKYTSIWARAFFSLVFVEVIHSLVIVVFFQALTQTSNVYANVFMCYGLLFLMYKIPSVIFQSSVIQWQPSPHISSTTAITKVATAAAGG